MRGKREGGGGGEKVMFQKLQRNKLKF